MSILQDSPKKTKNQEFLEEGGPGYPIHFSSLNSISAEALARSRGAENAEKRKKKLLIQAQCALLLCELCASALPLR
jgi:hypothetical protein